jgi:hypothetical protein
MSTPTCPLCGLRYTDRSLLDLHIREDHVQRDRPPRPDPPGDTAPPAPPPASPPPSPSPPRVARSGWAATARRAAATALTRAIRAMRHANPPAGQQPPG